MPKNATIDPQGILRTTDTETNKNLKTTGREDLDNSDHLLITGNSSATVPAITIAAKNTAHAASTGGTTGALGEGVNLNLTAQAGALATKAGGSITITAGAGASGISAGGSINLVPGAAGSTGAPGEVQINSNSAIEVINLNYTASLVTQTIFTATRACRVKAIIGRTRVAGSGGACTIAFFKCATTVAVGSGVALHSGSFNLVGTADANQTLTLSTTVADVTLAAGDSIGYVLTGTATSAVGSVSVHIAPA